MPPILRCIKINMFAKCFLHDNLHVLAVVLKYFFLHCGKSFACKVSNSESAKIPLAASFPGQGTLSAEGNLVAATQKMGA